MNPARKALRDGTAEAHDRVDAAFAGFDLTDRAGYAAFLRAHAEVLLPLEDALDAAGAERIIADWPERRRSALLKEDLAFLPPPRHPREGGHPDSQAAPSATLNPRLRGDDDWGLDNDAAIAGALYVIEGSRLGGRFLARQLPHGFPREFLDANQEPARWRNLLDRLETILYQPPLLQSALAAASKVFEAFERSAERWAKG